MIKKIENKELILELVSNAIDFQNAGKGHAFIYVQGHVNCIDARFYVGGWSSGKKPELEFSIYDEKESIKNAIIKLKNLHENTPSAEDVRKIEAERREAVEKKEYERLKAKFELKNPKNHE